ncbi:Ltp family lipoprotein [Bifidobacterium longum]|uniref:Ltp family lipoprotein n=1 Tax=Bifidobacterium longum TaxID=216816 RepID=UPI0023EB9DAB|nr:Ltp family lipoprotein [Bifidobacterium longum]MDF4082352.1 Ltp family lipoprotein [Bifidobacterium longum]
MGNNNKAPMMQPIPLAQPQGPQPPQNAQTMPGQTFGQPTGGVPGYAQPGQPKPKKPIWKQWWFWVIIVVVVVLDIAIIGGAGNSQGGGSAVDSSSAQSVAPKSTQKATPKKDAKLTGITASYSGSIKDGEQVTDKTSGITVTAKYDDGTTKNVTGWKIQNPGAVNINAPTEFTIEYEGQTAKVSIQAQPPVEYQNALNKAKSYSDMMHMSKQGIYDQLTSEYGEKFPAEPRNTPWITCKPTTTPTRWPRPSPIRK